MFVSGELKKNGTVKQHSIILVSRLGDAIFSNHRLKKNCFNTSEANFCDECLCVTFCDKCLCVTFSDEYLCTLFYMTVFFLFQFVLFQSLLNTETDKQKHQNKSINLIVVFTYFSNLLYSFMHKGAIFKIINEIRI